MSGIAVLGIGIGVLIPGEINIGKAEDTCLRPASASTQAAVDLGGSKRPSRWRRQARSSSPIGVVTAGAQGLVWQFLLESADAQRPATVSIAPGPSSVFAAVQAHF